MKPARPGDGRRNLARLAGQRAHLIGWALTAWPIFFLIYQELYREGIEKLTFAEMLAYGAPVLALPLLGYLVKILVDSRTHLAATRAYLQSIIDHMDDILLVMDKDKRIVFGNPLLSKVFGDVIGRPCRKAFPGETGCGSVCPAEECFQGGRSIRIRRRLVPVDGAKRWFDISANPFRDEDGAVIGVMEIWRDITHQVDLEDKLREQALTDSLTQINNSRSFFQNLPAQMQRAFRQKHPLALLMIDIDGFKSYNDTFGHRAGDRILRKLGAIIREQIRKDVDSCYRYGGDEFAVILPDLTSEAAVKVAERISSSFGESDMSLVSLSIGVAILKEGLNPNQLIDQADQAMYLAKSDGGNRIRINGS